jgi:GTPase SAR1 family protein
VHRKDSDLTATQAIFGALSTGKSATVVRLCNNTFIDSIDPTIGTQNNLGSRLLKNNFRGHLQQTIPSF